MENNLQVWGGYAERVMRYPSEYDAIEVQGVREEYTAQQVTVCEVDNDNPQFFSVYAHLKAGGSECIGDFKTGADAVEYGMVTAVFGSWPLHVYLSGYRESTFNSDRDVSQWYIAAASESERRELVGRVNCEFGCAKNWGRLTFEAQSAVKARRMHTIIQGLRMAANIASRRA